MSDPGPRQVRSVTDVGILALPSSRHSATSGVSSVTGTVLGLTSQPVFNRQRPQPHQLSPDQRLPDFVLANLQLSPTRGPTIYSQSLQHTNLPGATTNELTFNDQSGTNMSAPESTARDRARRGADRIR